MQWNDLEIGDTYEREKENGEIVIYEILEIKDGAIISKRKEDE
ncbi:MAG: hypothetical protein ACOC2J_04625 [bacterium]